MYLVSSVRPFMCVFVQALLFGVITSLEVFVCVSVISGCMRVIAQMQPICFYFRFVITLILMNLAVTASIRKILT